MVVGAPCEERRKLCEKRVEVVVVGQRRRARANRRWRDYIRNNMEVMGLTETETNNPQRRPHVIGSKARRRRRRFKQI